MLGLGLLFALGIFFVSVILPIALLVRTNRLDRQLRDIQATLDHLQGRGEGQPEAVAARESRTPQEPPGEGAPQPAAEPAPVQAAGEPRQTGVETPVPETPGIVAQPPRRFVFTEEFGPQLAEWLKRNWFYAVAAVSLGLAGVFLVLYGIEKGILTPPVRVLGALALGAALIAAGERLRRRYGDEEGPFALIPSSFSGAGLVSIFSGILAARLMYGLIGAYPALGGLVLTCALAVLLGWFYGPLLAVVGVLGALAAPFLVGGSSDAAYLLHFYFAIVAAVAFAVDSYKRWAWLTGLGGIGAYVAAVLLYQSAGNEVSLIGFELLTAAAAIILPEMRLVPRQEGETLTAPMFSRRRPVVWPEFPTRAASWAFLATTALLTYVSFLISAGQGSGAVFGPWVLFAVLVSGYLLLIFGALIWMRHAPALRDLAYAAPIAGLAAAAYEALVQGVFWQRWIANAERLPLEYPDPTLAILLGAALVISALFAWRSASGHGFRLADAIMAAAYAPVMAVMLELLWQPSQVLGTFNWALYLAVPALVMTVIAERFSHRFLDERSRMALFAVSALVMIAFMAVVLLSSIALTIAFSVLIAAAAALRVRLRLPLLDRYVQVGVLTVAWRLVLDPGLVFAHDGPLAEVVLVFAAALAAIAAAHRLTRTLASVDVRGLLEVAGFALAGVFASVLLSRYYAHLAATYVDLGIGHAQASVVGVTWLLLAMVQFERHTARPSRLAEVLGLLFAAAGTVLVWVAVVPENPVFAWQSQVRGLPVLNTLSLAYALPAACYALVAWRYRSLHRVIRLGAIALAAGLVALDVALEIRFWWQGSALWHPGTPDGELYSYTVAMLLAAAGLLVLAFLRQSALLRRLALVAVGLTVAKVYLIDMSGLAGLLRVVSFLVLGLVLAAMAWVNRLLQANEAARQ